MFNVDCNLLMGVDNAWEQEKLEVRKVFEKRYRDQQLKYLEKKAAKFGLQLVPPNCF